MTKTVPLDEQIVATLTTSCHSDQAAAVLADAETELTSLTRQADAADVASLDPLASATQARARRQEAADLHFEADRLEASVAALNVRIAELKAAERDARHAAAKAAVVAQRDDLAAEIAERYPAIVGELTSLVKRIQECDALCERVRVEGPESIGRGVAANFYSHGGPIGRISDARLPMPTGGHFAWDASTSGWRWTGLSLLADAEA